jgi:hypothetical protein
MIYGMAGDEWRKHEFWGFMIKYACPFLGVIYFVLGLIESAVYVYTHFSKFLAL